MSNNSVFELLCRGRTSPIGWGFPPKELPAPYTSPSRLRGLLCFMSDDDGNAQLVRWYHAMIRCFPGVWRSLAGEEEGYNPHLFHKQALDSISLLPSRSLVTGTLELGWIPGAETHSLTGQIDGNILTLGDAQYPVQFQPGEEDRSEMVLPEFFGCRASVLTAATVTANTVFFRPRAFNAQSVVDSVLAQGSDDLNNAGLLDSFLSLPRLEDKLAVAWLALAKLEDTV